MIGPKVKIGFLALVAAIAAFTLTMIGGPGSHTAEGVLAATVTIGSDSIDPGATTVLTLQATDVTDLGAWNVTVDYDDSVVQVNACVRDSAWDAGLCNSGTSGTLIVNGASVFGLSGATVDLAAITFEAVGSGGDSTVLDVTVNTFSDAGSTPISVTDVDGSIDINAAGGPGIIAFASIDTDINTPGVQECLGNVTSGDPVSVDIILDAIDPADGSLTGGGGGNIGVTFTDTLTLSGTPTGLSPFLGSVIPGPTEPAGAGLSRLVGFTIFVFPGGAAAFDGVTPFARITFNTTAPGVVDIFPTDVPGFDDTRDLTIQMTGKTFDANDDSGDGNIVLNLVGGRIAIGEACPVPNIPPVAGNVNMGAVPEDSVDNPWTPDVSDTDSGPSPLTCSIDTQPTNGAATVASNCSTGTYTPDSNFFGSDPFTYAVTDGEDSSIDVVSVNVTSVNDVPVANPVAMDAVPENSVDNPWTADVSDVDTGDTLTCSIDTQPTNGAATVVSDCSSGTYTPDTAFTGDDPFVYMVDDGNSGTDTATVTVNVSAVNFPPDAVDDSFNVTEDSSDNVLDVLANDSDPNNDTLTIIDVTAPPNGQTATLGDDVRYTPDPNYCGADNFSYTISDGELTDTAAVSVDVACVNDAPVAGDDEATVPENSGATAIDVLANDTDQDGDTLIVGSVSQPANGLASFDSSQVFYTPDTDFIGDDTFTYGVLDGNGGGDAAVVTVHVVPNLPPVASDVAMGTVQEDSTANAWTPDVSDPDAETTLTCSINTQPTNGAATVASDCSSGTYTPNADFFGSDLFIYEVSDGDLTDTGVVSVTVTNVNDPTVASNVDMGTVQEDSVDNAWTPVVSDIDGDTLTCSIDTQPTNGVATVASNCSSGTYTPNADFFGSDSFTYKANDGAADSNTASVDVTVINDLSDAPTASDQTTATLQGQNVDIALAGSDPDGCASQSFTFEIVDGPSNGSVDPTDGAATCTNPLAATVTYTPNAGFSGADSFTYRFLDSTERSSDPATVTVVVNDPPVAVDVDMGNVDEDSTDNAWTPVVSDPNGDTLTCSIVGQPANGTATIASDCSSGTYTPNAGFTGSDPFTYNANDGTADSNTATVTVTVPAVLAATPTPTLAPAPAPTPTPTPTPTDVAGASALPTAGGPPMSGGSTAALLLTVIALSLLAALAGGYLAIQRSRATDR